MDSNKFGVVECLDKYEAERCDVDVILCLDEGVL